MADLIARLRDNEHDTPSARAVMNEAAGQIEQLQSVLQGLRHLAFNSRTVLGEEQNDQALVDRLIAAADELL